MASRAPAPDTPPTLVLAPLDQGVRNVGGRPGTAQGPERVLAALEERSVLGDLPVERVAVQNTAEGYEEDLEALSRAVEEVVRAQRFPMVLGGSHGTTYAVVRGLARALGPVGVAYLDVHFDMRPFQPVHTSGSSFRRLVEEAVVEPGHVHPLGLQRPTDPEALERSGYDALEAWADEQGIPHRSLEEVRAQGVGASVAKALEGGVPTHFSFDVDALSQQWAPGVSAPGADRFTLEEGLEAVEAAASRCAAFDVVEYAPGLDEGARTLESVVAVLERLLTVRANRSAAP